MVYPLVFATHPLEPNQIALGMSDGAIHVVEPFDVEQKWGGPSSQDNGDQYLQIHQILTRMVKYQSFLLGDGGI